MKTIYRLTKLNNILRSHRLKFAAAFLAHRFGVRHLAVRIDPVMACNLRCQMCFFSNDEYAKSSKGSFTENDIAKLASMFFRRALLVVFGCGTEPTLYADFPELVRIAKQHRVPYIGFTTNGQLLTKEHIEKFIAYGLDELTISVHGVEKETYERFMVNASFETLHSVLQTLNLVKVKCASAIPRVRLNYTVNPENLRELEHFFDTYGAYNISTLQVRPIIDFHGKFRQVLRPDDLQLYKEVLARLGVECKSRNITFLANTADPAYDFENHASAILQAVHRRITPSEVWRQDFDWRNETYDEFCDRIGWGKYLLKSVLSNARDVARFSTGTWGKHSVKFEVEL